MPILSATQIDQIIDEIKADARVGGILLTGSYVYGQPNEQSDVDVRCVTNNGTNWAEFERMRFGARVEVFFNTPAAVREYMEASRLAGHGDTVHFWAHGKIVHDPQGTIKELQDEAARFWKLGPESGKDWEWRSEKHRKYNGTYEQLVRS